MIVITVARKPCGGSVSSNVLKHGTGAMNIDACRIGTDVRTYKGSGASPQKLENHGPGDTGVGLLDGRGRDLEFTVNGRWPANVILSDLAACVLDEQKPFTSQTGVRKNPERGHQEAVNTPFTRGVNAPEYTDSGGASRFFKVVGGK